MYIIRDFEVLRPSRFTRHSEFSRLVMTWVCSVLNPEDDGRVLLRNMGIHQSGRSTMRPSFVIIGLASATVNFSSAEPK